MSEMPQERRTRMNDPVFPSKNKKLTWIYSDLRDAEAALHFIDEHEIAKKIEPISKEIEKMIDWSANE